MAQFLASELRFGSGDAFRGRYLDMSITRPLEEGVFPTGASLAAGLMKSAYDHVVIYGNDLTIQGPRLGDIPVAMEVNRMNTPASVLFHGFLLVKEGQVERIDFRTITHFNPRILGLLGIKFVLSHHPLDMATVQTLGKAHLPVGTALYELPNANVGQYSPTEAVLITAWQSVLERMAAPQFDPLRLAILHDKWAPDTPYAPAKATIAKTLKGYRVVATSAGASLLVLPFEFSRCLVVKDLGGTARIGRADFFLTGLTFERTVDAEIQFRFGPFENSSCRLQDLADLRAMGLDTASFAAFRKKYPRRFLLEGLF